MSTTENLFEKHNVRDLEETLRGVTIARRISSDKVRVLKVKRTAGHDRASNHALPYERILKSEPGMLDIMDFPRPNGKNGAAINVTALQLAQSSDGERLTGACVQLKTFDNPFIDTGDRRKKIGQYEAVTYLELELNRQYKLRVISEGRFEVIDIEAEIQDENGPRLAQDHDGTEFISL
jgi:hypothetical protein